MNERSIYSETLLKRAKEASRELALIDSRTKTNAILAMAEALTKKAGHILKANYKDVAMARGKLPKVLVDRLTLDKKKLSDMSDALRVIARLKDPIGEVLQTLRRPNGLLIKKVRVPIGVILMIYEARPNVTSDCAGLCLKSGNAAVLRGGSEAINSNIAIFEALDKAATLAGIPKGALTMIERTDRTVVKELLSKIGFIDLVMPRGGESLIKFVSENSRLPVIKHYKGVCHTYVDKAADLGMAEEICFNAKVQRPGVCNAMETLLVHRAIAKRFLAPMLQRYLDAGVELRGTFEVKRLSSGIVLATEEDWYAEYLDLILSVKIVKDIDDAIGHIMKYGSFHSDAIITKSATAANKFMREIDSACVYVNASTRFTDGGEFGKGAEIGISTDKIHARGPMGIEELTSYKYLIYGSGQVRT